MELFSVSAFAPWLGPAGVLCVSVGGDSLDSSTYSSYTIIVCLLYFDAHIQCWTVAWTVIPGFDCCSFLFHFCQRNSYIRTWLYAAASQLLFGLLWLLMSVFLSLNLKLYYFHPTHRHIFLLFSNNKNKNHPGVSLEFLNGSSIYQESKQ